MARREAQNNDLSDLSDNSDDGLEHDGVGLVIPEDGGESTSKARRRVRQYRVSEGEPGKSTAGWVPSFFRLHRLSRNERICLALGAIVLITLVVVFVTIAIVARPVVNTAGTAGAPGEEGGSEGGDGSGGEGVVSGGGEEQVPWGNIRLQSSVVPESYDISLKLNMDDFQVTGSVNISCSLTDSVDYIALHFKDMTILPDGHRVMRDGKSVEHSEATHSENDFYIFNLTEPLIAGPIHLLLNFSYTLRNDLAGFYRSSYTDSEGNTQYLGTTQFEPTDARRAFPCLDEPALKANFTMHITHQSRYWATSNMPPMTTTEEDADGFVTTHFETSVRMSTYLVAFVVSNFQCINETITSTSGNPLLIQVCSSPVVAEHTTYALEVAKKVIMFYEQEFGIPYPLPKQELFAIPDFAVGAMENWGLITYRETALLYDETRNPATSKARVATVIAHELAHQWFGDLVTMAWWDGLWLNEGFASFMEYLGTDSAEPSFNMLDQFFVDDVKRALDLDSLAESHPILQVVENPDEINSLFDGISYNKGSSIIHMIREYIGHDAFRNGITLYLNKHKYGNAETPELWEALQTTFQGNGSTVTEIMDTWTKQMGYPVFMVNQTAGTLTQTRFFSVKPKDTDSIASSPYNYVWKSPFNYLYYSNISSEAVNRNIGVVTSQSVPVNWETGGWIKANLHQAGFYRVNYEISNWLKITDYLKHHMDSSVLSANDRAGLIDDAFALSYAGQLDSRVALNLSIYLVGEREYTPWIIALSWFSKLGGILSLTPHYGRYKEFVGPILGPVVKQFPTTSTNLTLLEIYLRSAVLSYAAKYGNEEVIGNATELFRQWKMENISVDPDLKPLVYGIGVSQGGVEEWDFVWQKHNQSNDPYEKRLYRVALASSKELWILQRYLNYSISKLRSQDTLSVVIYVSRNIYGRSLAWKFVRSNWNYFYTVYGEGSFFYTFIRYITEDFATEFELNELSEFYDKIQQQQKAGTAARGFLQSIEVVKGNIAWVNANEDFIFN